MSQIIGTSEKLRVIPSDKRSRFDTPQIMTLSDSYMVLGVSAEATADIVDQAYGNLRSDIAPSHNMTHSRTTIALSILDELEEAYETILQHRYSKIAG